MRHVALSRHRKQLLASRAHALREFTTLSERRLWVGLSGAKLGVSFRRQVVLAGKYIADFYAPALRLVVEVDGGIHAHRQRADARRDETLRRYGYHVLRLDAELVTRNLPAVLARVGAEVVRLG